MWVWVNTCVCVWSGGGGAGCGRRRGAPVGRFGEGFCVLFILFCMSTTCLLCTLFLLPLYIHITHTYKYIMAIHSTHQVEVEGVGGLDVAEEAVLGKVVLGAEGVDGGGLEHLWGGDWGFGVGFGLGGGLERHGKGGTRMNVYGLSWGGGGEGG